MVNLNRLHELGEHVCAVPDHGPLQLTALIGVDITSLHQMSYLELSSPEQFVKHTCSTSLPQMEVRIALGHLFDQRSGPERQE